MKNATIEYNDINGNINHISSFFYVHYKSRIENTHINSVNVVVRIQIL